MLRIRLLFAWLVLAAIPLQGFAAASMLFCGIAPSTPQAHAQVMSKTSAGHDHATHGHAASEPQQSTPSQQQLPDSGHSCGVCAACSHTVAITETPATLPVASLPQSEAAEPFVLIHAGASPVPDKPPRI